MKTNNTQKERCVDRIQQSIRSINIQISKKYVQPSENHINLPSNFSLFGKFVMGSLIADKYTCSYLLFIDRKKKRKIIFIFIFLNFILFYLYFKNNFFIYFVLGEWIPTFNRTSSYQ